MPQFLDLSAQTWKLVSKTAAYTAARETVILVDASGGNVTISLPAAAGVPGRPYCVKKIDSSAVNIVTIDPNGSETIDGAATLILYVQHDYVWIISDGTNWWIITDGRQLHRCEMISTAATSLLHDTATKISMGRTDVNVGGLADLTNSRARVRRAGEYRIDGLLSLASLPAGARYTMFLFAGDPVALKKIMLTNFGGGTATNIYATGGAKVNLTAGDYLELFGSWDVSGGSGSLNTVVVADSVAPYLSITEVR